MSSQVSDVHLTALLEKYSEFEKPFFQFLIDNNQKIYLENFANTPTWAIMALFQLQKDDYMSTSIISHQNFDQQMLQEILSGSNTTFISAAVHSPHITNRQLENLASDNKWANYYLMRNTGRVEEFILGQLNSAPENRDYTLGTALREENLSETLIMKVLKQAEEPLSGTGSDKIGEQILSNPNLIDEHRAMIHLLGIQKKNVEPNYSLYPTTQYILRKSTLYAEGFNDEIVQALFEVGHPLALLNPNQQNPVNITSNFDLSQIIQSEFLHRIFWIELSKEIEGFGLNIRNGYRVFDLFVNHPSLAEEFNNSDYEDGWKCGGVIDGYEDREWFDKEEYLDPERVESLLTNYSEDLEEIIQDCETFEESQARVLAFLSFVTRGLELKAEYDVELTEAAEIQVTTQAEELAELEDYEFTAEFNQFFNEELTWKNLSVHLQKRVLESLLNGYKAEPSKLQRDCEHFLACMALHPATSAEIVDALENLDSHVIQSTLKLRQ